MGDPMQANATTTRLNMLICPQRCSDALRAMAGKHGWALLEGIGSIPAVHACVAIEPEQVCVEFVRTPRAVPDILRRLGSLSSVRRVGCLMPGVGGELEGSLVRLGVSVLGSVEEAERWLCPLERGAVSGEVIEKRTRAATPYRVQRRALSPQGSIRRCD